MTYVAPSLGRYARLIARIDTLQQKPGIEVEVLAVLRRTGYALPLLRVRATARSPHLAFVGAGIHGDEPAGPHAVVDLLERFDPNTAPCGIFALPCLNPGGFIYETRENELGYDLNRTFGQDPAPAETVAARAAVAGEHFDCVIDLHEDSDAAGCYVYEHVRGREPIAPEIVKALRARGYPIQPGERIEQYALRDGCVEEADESTGPHTGYIGLYLFEGFTDRALTPETPSALPLPVRVDMHRTAIETALRAL